MKNLLSIGTSFLLLNGLFVLFSFNSCSKENDENGIKVYEYREQIGKKIKELSDLLSASQFGFRKDMYPVESRPLVEDAVDDLKKLLEEIKTGAVTINQVPSETDNRIAQANSKMTQFLDSRRIADMIVAAELHVNGKEGGYIDFGNSPAFSDFDSGFTVDMWFKFEEIGNFDFLLSTFIDTGRDDPRLRQGWAVNYYGEGGASNLRMTYTLGTLDLYEPWVRFTEAKKWVHIAYVWNPLKENDGSGNPRTFKMYLDGELVKEEDWHQIDYNPNVQNTSMIGFNHTNFDGSISSEGKGTNGYMKNMHIWNSVKSQRDIHAIMETPETVVGTETDLVCGWNFTQIADDNNNIPDITGKYTAKLVGNFQWKPL